MIETWKKKKISAANARKDARIGFGELPATGIILGGHCLADGWQVDG
jgi:hypothetical protein